MKENYDLRVMLSSENRALWLSAAGECGGRIVEGICN